MGKARSDVVRLALLTGDLHWSDNPRDSYRHDFVDELVDTIGHEKVTDLFLLGDLTESKEGHSPWLTNQVVDHINRLAESCYVTIIKGNHDYLDPEWPFFRFLRHLPNVSWVNEPAITRFGWGKDHDTLLLPHTTSPKEDWKTWKWSSFELIFTHMTFDGARGENGTELKGISTDIFGPKDKKRPFVYSGDVHVPQRVGPVTYVGAPYTIDFGDKFEPRFMLLTDDGQEMSVKAKGPQKRLVTVMDIAELSKEKVDKGDVLKVRVGITADEHAKWGEIQERVREWGRKKGCVVYVVEPVVLSADKKSSAKRLHRARKADSALVKEYAQQRGRSDATVRTGLKLLESS